MLSEYNEMNDTDGLEYRSAMLIPMLEKIVSAMRHRTILDMYRILGNKLPIHVVWKNKENKYSMYAIAVKHNHSSRAIAKFTAGTTLEKDDDLFNNRLKCCASMLQNDPQIPFSRSADPERKQGEVYQNVGSTATTTATGSAVSAADQVERKDSDSDSTRSLPAKRRRLDDADEPDDTTRFGNVPTASSPAGTPVDSIRRYTIPSNGSMHVRLNAPSNTVHPNAPISGIASITGVLSFGRSSMLGSSSTTSSASSGLSSTTSSASSGSSSTTSSASSGSSSTTSSASSGPLRQ
jgi:hypothetical protein